MNAAATLAPALTEAQKIAHFAINLRLQDVPMAVVDKARVHLLDVLGIALASSRFDFGHAVLAGVRKLGSGHEASALGSGVRLPAASAALVNGVLAHSLDFDDTHIGAIYHASAQAMAATFASGQAHRASGEEALLAFIVALEIGCRLASAGAGELHHRGFHPTALCGTFAAATAAGRLAQVGESALTSALGLCGSQAAGILEIGTSWLKRLHPGWAAHAGLAAVALAESGFIGPDTVFEGDKGFFATHLQKIPRDNALPSVGLGQQWQILGIALKPYPCCHFIHAFVDAALALRGQFENAEIERIDCLLTPMLHPLVAEPRDVRIRPQTTYQALFSVPYVVALALARGRVDLAAFYDQPLDAPDVLALAERCFCVDDPASDFPKHFPGELVVHLKDGSSRRVRRTTSFGTPEDPMPLPAVQAKFVANATRVIGEPAALTLINRVLRLETLDSLDEIVALCTAA